MLQNSEVFSGFSVDDLSKAKEFYGSKLGLSVVEMENDMGLELRFANDNSHFIYPKADHQPATFTVLNFKVPDIDAVIDELSAKGVQFERYETLPAKQDDRGVLRGLRVGMGPDIAWFKDPAGNILSILQDA